MKEKDFIKQNHEKWKNFDEKSTKAKPEQLAENFNQITSDLSYSRTYYPHRSIKLYLNEKTSKFFIDIYKSKKSNVSSFVNFWKYEIPCIAYMHRFEFYITLAVCLLGIGIGLLSFNKDPDFAAHMLGPDYIAMTEENIKNNDPMGVYKDGGRFEMFWRIAQNNIKVSFFVYAMGLFFGIGSLIDILFESVRISAFLMFFIKRDLGFSAYTSIFMHGAIEVSSLLVAGAAGFIMGKGLIFPGTYGRFQSFQMSAKRGIKIILSLIPFFLFAGFIEGYITRMTDINPYFRLAFIVVCFVFVIFYFFVYPRYVVQLQGSVKYLTPEKIQPIVKETPNKYGIMKSDEIYNRAISFVMDHGVRYFTLASVVALAWTVALFYYERQQVVSNYQVGMSTDVSSYWSWPFERVDFLFNHIKHHFWATYLVFLLGVPWVFTQLRPHKTFAENQKIYLNILAVTGIFTCIMWLKTEYYILFFLLSSFYFICIEQIIMQQKSFWTAIADTFIYVKENIGLFFGVNIVFMFVSLVFLVMSYSPLWFYFTYFTGMIIGDEKQMGFQYYFFTYFVYLIALFAFFMMYACNTYLFKTLVEINDGATIKAIIKKLSPSRR